MTPALRARLEAAAAAREPVALHWTDADGHCRVERVLVRGFRPVEPAEQSMMRLLGAELLEVQQPGRDRILVVDPLRVEGVIDERRPSGVAWGGMLATCHPQSAVEAGRVAADALISICPPGKSAAVREGDYPAGVLRLGFDDVPPGFGRGTACAAEHLAEALRFAAGAEAAGARRLAVHCWMGRSRSAAVALSVLAQSLGPGREADAVALLLDQDPGGVSIQPQPGIVRLADALLARGGAIERELSAASPNYRSWRDYWVRSGAITA